MKPRYMLLETHPRYQIKQEEKRKNRELEQKERMQKLYISLGLAGVMLIVYFITTLFDM